VCVCVNVKAMEAVVWHLEFREHPVIDYVCTTLIEMFIWLFMGCRKSLITLTAFQCPLISTLFVI